MSGAGHLASIVAALERDVLQLAIYVFEYVEADLRSQCEPVSDMEHLVIRLRALVLEADGPVSHKYLRKMTGACPRTMRKALGIMESRGWIVWSRKTTHQKIQARWAA